MLLSDLHLRVHANTERGREKREGENGEREGKKKRWRKGERKIQNCWQLKGTSTFKSSSSVLGSMLAK